jgi:hypothetical protein
MGLPKGRFSIYRGTELHPQSRLDFAYGTQSTVDHPSRLVDTKWLCWGAIDSAQARFRVVDGQEEDGGWSCRMKIDDGPYAGYWLDSSDGYVCAVGSSSQRWRFARPVRRHPGDVHHQPDRPLSAGHRTLPVVT